MKIFPIFGIMFLIMFTLKIAEVGAVATWSWWLVTLPLWGPLAILIGFLALVALGVALGLLTRGGK